MQSKPIEVRVDPPVATIKLNRPEKRNALTSALIAELSQAFADIHLEKRARAVILTGAGDAFCAGRDVNEMVASDADPATDFAAWGEQAQLAKDLMLQMLEFPKPIIAAVNGPAMGFGAGLVLASDIVVGCNQADFGLQSVRLGLVAGVEAPLAVFRLGAGLAARLLLTGACVTGDQALRLGLHHEHVERDLVWAKAVEIGKQCAEGSPEAIQLTKRLLLETIGEQLPTQLTGGAIAAATARTTESATEGVNAFIEKRPPEW